MSPPSAASPAESLCDLEALIRLATNGERAAQGQLLLRYGPALLRSVRRQLRGQQPGGKRPSDLVQDTSERALRYFHTFQGTTDRELKKWLFLILRSSIIEAIREAGAQKRGDGAEPVGGLEETLHPAPIRSAASLLDARLQVRQVFAVLCQLPPRQRDALRFRALHGMTTAQLAAQLDCTEDAAASLLKRGLRELHVKLRGVSLGVARGRQAQIDRGLLDYLRRRDRGEPVSLPVFLEGYPAVAAPLAAFIDWLEQLHGELQADGVP